MANRPTKTPETPATPAATFSPEALAALLAEVTESRKAMAGMKLELDALKLATAKPQAANGKGDQSHKNDLAAVKAFKRAGFGILKPHEDIRTFGRWIAAGYRPVAGSKSVKVGGLRLFCKAQLRELTKEERAEAQAKSDEGVSANKAKIDAGVAPKAAAKPSKVVPISGQTEMPL